MKLDLFERAISIKRDGGTPSEMRFVAYLAERFEPTMIDEAGNLHFDRRGQNCGTLFVAHTDTIVHKKGSVNLWEKDKDGFYRAKGDTLGADDAAGICILGHLMDMGVPGYYIFFRGEESGGTGSRYLAKHHADLCCEFDRAIAFDRRGYSDVITHQAGGRCASDAFGEELSSMLNNEGLLYMPCDGGIFTDTANLMDLIPECTNISVGYDWEHSDKEEQDGNYLMLLGAACARIRWEALPTERDPAEIEDDVTFNLYGKEIKDEGTVPPTRNAEDDRICEAWEAALDRQPGPLMTLVAKYLKTDRNRLDEEVFSPAEVYAVALGAGDWQQVIEELAELCELQMPH